MSLPNVSATRSVPPATSSTTPPPATKERWSPVQLLEHVVEREEKDHVWNAVSIAASRPATSAAWADGRLRLTWPTKIDRERVERALDVGFIAEARNIVLVAPQGLAKSVLSATVRSSAG